jgi:ankyrin repeat protein
MMHIIVTFTFLLSSIFLPAFNDERPAYPSYDYDVARAHEIKPHRQTIPVSGVLSGFNQLRLTLIMSPKGDVVHADAAGDGKILKFWPQLQNEVRLWKFMPFEIDGRAVTAEIEEYLDLVPPERMPKKHVTAPVIRPNSKVRITLERTGCFGSCPGYIVAVSTDGIVFDGRGFVVAAGNHKDTVDPREVRHLGEKFIAADFYSMDAEYRAGVTDNPAYGLSVEIDRHVKQVEDYVGAWEGMPAVITELEDAIDAFARTDRWINGSAGLVQVLQSEKFKFHSFEAQVMLKEAARRDMAETVTELLNAGVPLEPLPALQPNESGFQAQGWLTSASSHQKALQVLIDASASKNDQNDKDLALVGAASSGDLRSVRALIDYGANPNADLTKLVITETGGSMELQMPGAGGILFYAAESGNPEMVREFLAHHPNLESRGPRGKTAVFAAAEYRYRDEDGARVECVRLLAEAGANVKARDNDGNTPLHETFLTDVEEELLRLGADVNARNNQGETPIFTTVDNNAIRLFIEHGADLSIRNNKGETVIDAAKRKGPLRQKTLSNAIQKLNKP